MPALQTNVPAAFCQHLPHVPYCSKRMPACRHPVTCSGPSCLQGRGAAGVRVGRGGQQCAGGGHGSQGHWRHLCSARGRAPPQGSGHACSTAGPHACMLPSSPFSSTSARTCWSSSSTCGTSAPGSSCTAASDIQLHHDPIRRDRPCRAAASTASWRGLTGSREGTRSGSLQSSPC